MLRGMQDFLQRRPESQAEMQVSSLGHHPPAITRGQPEHNQDHHTCVSLNRRLRGRRCVRDAVNGRSD